MFANTMPLFVILVISRFNFEGVTLVLHLHYVVSVQRSQFPLLPGARDRLRYFFVAFPGHSIQLFFISFLSTEGKILQLPCSARSLSCPKR